MKNLRYSAALLVAITASAAEAQEQNGIRPIAWTEVTGKGMSLNLSYPDGSGKLQLYTSDNIYRPALSPRGGQVAFRAPVCGCIRILTYNETATGVTVTAVNDVAPGGWQPTFSPDGSKLAYTLSVRDAPPQIRWLSLSDKTLTFPLTSGHFGKSIAWIAPTRIVYVADEPEDLVVELKLDANDPALPVSASQIAYRTGNIDGMGAAHTRNSIFVGHSTATGIWIREINLGTEDDLGDSTLEPGDIVWGAFPHASPDDSHLIYKAQNYTLSRINLSTKEVTVLVKGRSSRQADWRPPLK